MRIVVTGANRGIGLEFVRQCAARGDTVEATVRDPAGASALRDLASHHGETVRCHVCDVTNDASVAALARALGDGPVDVLVNNAGAGSFGASLTDLDMEEVKKLYDTNAIGPLRVTRALLPHLRRGTVRKVVHVSSQMGSIADNTSGGAYAYRMSKAALNMAARSMAADLRADGIAVAVLSPGWVQTDMGGPTAPTKASDSVAGMLRAIDGLTLDHTGSFLDFRGGEVIW